MSEVPIDYGYELSFAKDLATKAAKIAMQYYEVEPEFVVKADDSPVTEADEIINQMVIDAVKELFPDHGVLGEEQSWQLDQKQLWVCDPIDATMSFMMRVPTFMFSIALVDDGKTVVAVTANPVTDETFWATAGGGSYRNGKPIHVSPRVLSNAWLAFPTNTDVLVGSADMYQEFKKQAYMTDGIHGTVCKGMLIAQGSCDASIWPGTVQPWDAAAVKQIVEEAGGKLTDVDGGEHRFDTELTGGMIVSNGLIHNDVLEIAKTKGFKS